MVSWKNTLLYRIAVVAVMLAALFYMLGFNGQTISVATSIIAVVVVLTIFRHRNREQHNQDERTKKLSGYAAAWSWQITFMAVAGLYWIDYLGAAELSASLVLGILLFLMSATLIGFRWHFMKKGDAE